MTATDAAHEDGETQGWRRGGSARLEHPQSIRAVFFDAGFTMLAPHPSVVEIAARVCTERGTPVDAERLMTQLPVAEASLRRRAKEHPWAWSENATIDRMWTEYFNVLLAPVVAELPAEEAQACLRDCGARVRPGGELCPLSRCDSRAANAQSARLHARRDLRLGAGARAASCATTIWCSTSTSR